MASKSPGTFGHEDRKRIYEHIEANGPTDTAELIAALDIDPGGIRSHLAILEQDGLVYEDDGGFTTGFDPDDAEGAEDVVTEGDRSVTIRRARQRDRSGLLDAMREVTADGSYVVAESVADLIDHEDAVVRHDALGSRMVFVAIVDDEVAGWVHLQSPESTKLHHTAELTVGVRKAYQRLGIGSALLDRAFDWAETEGYEKLYNSIPSSNQGAIDFLEAHDWTVEATREDHYRLDDEYLDEVMMAYRV